MEERQVEEFLEQILGFSKPWKIEKVLSDYKEDKAVLIYLNYPKGTLFSCPDCGKLCSVYDSKYREFRHMDLWQHKTFIKAKVPRVLCCSGKKISITPFC